jgi:hypothetical protein
LGVLVGTDDVPNIPGLVGGLRSAWVSDRPSSANPADGVEDELERQSTRDLAGPYG